MSASGATIPRLVAFEVLRRVFEEDAWADRVLRSALERSGITGRDRAQAQRLALGAVQRRGTSDHLIERLARRSVERLDPPVLAALRLGLYELLYMDGSADHATVSQAVELAKGGRSGGRRGRGAGLVNAVLRRATRERASLLGGLSDRGPEDAAIMHSVPLWIAQLWWRELGPERSRALLGAVNEPARLSFRVVGGREPSELPEALIPVELPIAQGSELAVPDLRRVERGSDPATLDAIEELRDTGVLVPQSAGSAMAAALLGARPGERGLDLCAAPGIKASQLAAGIGAQGSLTAVERDPGRAAQLIELFGALGIPEPRLVIGDARSADIGDGYDRVLVDAPCTGLGTLASRPDLRWRRRPADLEQLPSLQRSLLERGIDAARTGGAVVYSVCTISKAEADAVVEAVIDSRSDVEVEDLTAEAPALARRRTRHGVQLTPERDQTEGFYIARLRKVDRG